MRFESEHSFFYLFTEDTNNKTISEAYLNAGNEMLKESSERVDAAMKTMEPIVKALNERGKKV